jgi:peptide/nickel transport system substrate-binding protein
MVYHLRTLVIFLLKFMKGATMKKVLIPLVLIMVAILLFTGCGSKATTTTQPSSTPSIKPILETTVSATTTPAQTIKKGGTLKFLYPFSPTTTPGWPGDSKNLQKLWTCWVTFEALVKLGSDGQPIPWLATSWKWSPDSKYIDFTLRQNVKFSDGTVFNADAVKLHFDQLITDKDATTTNWEKTEKIDDYTFRLYIKSFVVSFWGSVCGFSTVIASPTVLKQGVEYAKEHPVGTGPFLFKSLVKDVQMSFVKNPNYWQAGKPYLDGIDMITVKESLTQQAKLVAGEGDLLVLQFGKINKDMADKGFNVFAQFAGTNFMEFDTKNQGSPTNDVNVRLAIDYALDKKAMTDSMGYGYQQVNYQMMPLANPGYNKNLPNREYNPAKAKELLKAAGYANGLKLHVINMTGGEAIQVFLQQYLEAVGITVETEMVDNAKFWNYLGTSWNGVIVNSNTTGVYLPAFIKSNFSAASPYNKSVALPQDLLDKCDAAVVINDTAKFKAASDEIAKIIFDQCLFVPMFSSAGADIVAKYVKDSGIMTFIDWTIWDPASCWLDK